MLHTQNNSTTMSYASEKRSWRWIMLAFLPYTRWCPLGITGIFHPRQHNTGGGLYIRESARWCWQEKPILSSPSKSMDSLGSNLLRERHSNQVPQSSCNDQESKPSQWTPGFRRSVFWLKEWKSFKRAETLEHRMNSMRDEWATHGKEGIFSNVRYFSYLISLLFSASPFKTSPQICDLHHHCHQESSK